MMAESTNWQEWEQEHKEELKRIEDLRKKGHSHHCACRIVFGDGECLCDQSPLNVEEVLREIHKAYGVLPAFPPF